MKKLYSVYLQSSASDSFLANKAAQSLDIDVTKKLEHKMNIECDFESFFNIGLFIGNSGSGKTTFAKQCFGEKSFKSLCNEALPVIDQFPEHYTYEQCAEMLNGIGLSQVPCWIKPVRTLSNGQRFRAEAALRIAHAKENEIIAIDEWTSVVDRTVAKVMSLCISKMSRRNKVSIVLCSCHSDVEEWLAPDFIVDCNKHSFEDRRSLQQIRTERLQFEIREVERKTWQYFSRYHYLNENLPGGKLFTFGLFHNDEQIGFQCSANYVPIGKNTTPIFHFNRTVVHPDYCGFGLGVKLINETSEYMKTKFGYRIMAKFSSIPVYKALMKSKYWILKDNMLMTSLAGPKGRRKSGFRQKIKTYSFEYIGKSTS